jgi:tetratricopeptide (TPR) repeat protein
LFGEYRGIFKRSLVKDIVVILFIVIFVIFYKSRLVPFGWEWSEEGYPKEAAEVIAKNKIQGNMFNHYNYGGYLIWKMPGYKVFIDGRLEMYEGQAGDDYLTILYANKGYKELLEKYKINFFICYVRDPIIEMLIDDQNWKYAYNDSDYVVYVKNNSLNKAFLAKYWVKKKEDDFEKTYKGSVATYRAEEAHKRGLEALKKKDFFGALYFFQQAVNLDPKFTMARYDLATLYVNIGSIESAVRELEEILRLDPDNLPSRKSLEKIDRTFNREKN